MAQILTSAYFAGLLVVLAVILEQLVKAHWAEIVTALRGETPRRAGPALQRPPRRVAA